MASGRYKHDAVREMRRLRRRADALAFPDAPWEGRGYWNWKLPVHATLVRGESARRPVQAACAQVLIDTARRLAGEKPRALAQARVVAVLPWPDLFGGEVCVFFDPGYFAGFCERDGDYQRWTPRTDAGLVERLGLTVPADFTVRGFDTLDRDDEPPFETLGEIWLIGEGV